MRSAVWLRLLSGLYRLLTDLRNTLYERGVLSVYHSTLPVLSVGNVTAGGNAKTPLCIFLAKELRARGFTPVVLSRGYRGRVRGVRVVQAHDSPELVGDEPRLMADALETAVVVSADRAAGARLIEARGLGDVIILDDGFQHRRLARTLDIVAVSAGNEAEEQAFREGKLLPFGRFREDRDKALRRAGAVVGIARTVAGGCGRVDRLQHALPPALPYFSGCLRSCGVYALDGGAAPSGGKAAAFCGIAQPEGFFAALAALGFNLAMRRTYPDHYAFAQADLDALRRDAGGAPLVCTEKDAVKLRRLACAGVYVLRVAVSLERAEEFLELVVRSITRRTPRNGDPTKGD